MSYEPLPNGVTTSADIGMSVAVLGAGPAGMVAAHAAVMYGARNVIIYSKPRKSHLFGAQYLHAPIPGLYNPEPVKVKYTLSFGSADDYRRKVYGPSWDGSVSPEDLAEEHEAWDIRTVYSGLWSMYQELIVPADIGPADVAAISDRKTHDFTINTIPMPVLCSGGHTFRTQEIWAAGDAPEIGVRLPYSCPDSTVRLNGWPEPAWYRISNIYGHKTVEWPGTLATRPPINHSVKVGKPLTNNCYCWPNVLRVGRFGQWRKGALVHEVFDQVWSALDMSKIARS